MPAASVAISTTRLKEIRLSELVQGLARTTSRRSASDLRVHLVIEVFCKLLLAPGLIVDTTSGRKQLLELDACDEVLVLWCHQAVVLAKQENFVISFRPLSLFCYVSIPILVGHVHHLLRLRDWWAIVRWSAVVEAMLLLVRTTRCLYWRSTRWHMRMLLELH